MTKKTRQRVVQVGAILIIILMILGSFVGALGAF